MADDSNAASDPQDGALYNPDGTLNSYVKGLVRVPDGMTFKPGVTKETNNNELGKSPDDYYPVTRPIDLLQ